MEGFEVNTLEAVLDTADLFITSTGNKGIISAEHMARMKHNAIVGNIGHFDNEIDMAGLARMSDVRKVEIKPQVHEFVFPDGHSVIVLSEGRLLNLGNATGHPSFVMSMSFTNQVLAQIELYTRTERLPARRVRAAQAPRRARRPAPPRRPRREAHAARPRTRPTTSASPSTAPTSTTTTGTSRRRTAAASSSEQSVRLRHAHLGSGDGGAAPSLAGGSGGASPPHPRAELVCPAAPLIVCWLERFEVAGGFVERRWSTGGGAAGSCGRGASGRWGRRSSAKRTVPTPTLPPSAAPTARTVSSMPVRTTRTEWPRASDAGHQAVARSRAEAGADVPAAARAEHVDADHQERDPLPHGVGGVDHREGGVDDEADQERR